MNVPKIPQRILAWFGRLRLIREELQTITEEASMLEKLIPAKDSAILIEVLESVKKDADDAIKEINGVTDGHDPASDS